jgi:hypothetical protein
MTHKIGIIACALILGLCPLLWLSANGWEYYESFEKGFSLYYPPDWEAKEYGNELQLFSSAEFAKIYEGPGVLFGVYNYEIDEPVSDEEALREWLDVEKDFVISEFTEEELADQTWSYATAFNEKQDIRAEFYICTRGSILYIIAIGYTPSEIGAEFVDIISEILYSFSFIREEEPEATGLKHYSNQEWGLSFSYPAGWDIQENDINIIVSSDENLFYPGTDGAAVAVFKCSPEDLNIDEPIENTEQLWEKLKETEDSFTEDYRAYIEWQGARWLYIEFADIEEDVEAHFYVLLQEETVYMVGIMYHPREAEQDFVEAVEGIMSSMSLAVDGVK